MAKTPFAQWGRGLWHTIAPDAKKTACGITLPLTINTRQNDPPPGRHCCNCWRTEQAMKGRTLHANG